MPLGNIIDIFENEVRAYAAAHLDATDRIDVLNFDVYVVWSVKALQNWKALLSTSLLDGMYYELTYDGDKGVIYLDAYKKFENKVIGLTGIGPGYLVEAAGQEVT